LSASTGESIGEEGTGTFTQTGGSNYCGGDLILAHVSGTEGTYNLSGGLLQLALGMAQGDLNHTESTFNLSGTGIFEALGGDGIASNNKSTNTTVAVFNQTGGTNIPAFLLIGSSSNGDGSYLLSGGTLTISGAMTLTGSLAVFDATGGVATIGNISNASTVIVGVGNGTIGNLTVDGNYTQSAGLTQIDGSLTLANGGAFDLSGGTLKGSGTISGPIFNLGGKVSPGDSPGQLTINGNYTQSGGTSVFDVVLGGNTPGTDYSLLTIAGAASLAGTMEVDLYDGFAPHVGDQFTFLTAGMGVTGGFSKLTSNNGQFGYTVDYGTGDNVVEITVTSVPEPGCAAIAAYATMLLVRRRRRRRPSSHANERKSAGA
jgi:fibronectin-binding autotransporter adhesin